MYIPDKSIETFKLQHIRTTYRVNDEKGTVTAVAEFYMPYDLRGDGNQYFLTVGIAYVNKEDTFDVEKGKKLARARAEKEAFIQFSKILLLFQRKAERLCGITYKTISKMSKNIENQNKYIKRF